MPLNFIIHHNMKCSWSCFSGTQLCLTLPHRLSMPGFPVFHYLWGLFRFMAIVLLMPLNHLILSHLLPLLPSIFPSIRVFSNESAVWIRWPKYWSFSISPSNEYSGLISFVEVISWNNKYKSFNTEASFIEQQGSLFCTNQKQTNKINKSAISGSSQIPIKCLTSQMGRYQRVETFVHAQDVFLGIHIIVSIIKCGDNLLILYNCGFLCVCVCNN